VTLSLNSVLEKRGESGTVYPYAVLSDGTLLPPDSTAAVSLVATNTSETHLVVRSDELQLEAKKTGESVVQIDWRSSKCGIDAVSTGSVRVPVQMNDFGPTIDSGSMSAVTVAENLQANLVVATVLTSDKDGDWSPIFTGIHSLKYKARNGTLVEIRAASFDDWVLIVPPGLVTVVPNVRLDYEFMSELRVGILASNFEEDAIAAKNGTVLADASRVATDELVIVLTDVNDNAPIFRRNYYRARALPGTAGKIPSQNVFKAEAFDVDEGINGEVSYYLNNDAGVVDLDEDLGHIVVNSSNLERVDNTLHVIRAIDHGIPERSGYTNVTIDVYRMEQLAFIDLDITVTDFAEFENNFGLTVGSQLNVPVFLGRVLHVDEKIDQSSEPLPDLRLRRDTASATFSTTLPPVPIAPTAPTQTRLIVIPMIDEYSGLDRQQIIEKLHDVQVEKTYPSYDGAAFSEVLAGFDFESAFGVKALRIGPYTELEYARPAADSSLEETTPRSSAVSWIMVAVGCLIVITGTFVYVIYKRKRSINDEEARMKMLLNQRTGAAFQFSGGEVDPETGKSFFSMPTSPQGRGSMGKYQQGSAFASIDPVSPDQAELGADFSNPLYKGRNITAETSFDTSSTVATAKFLAKYGSSHPLASVAAPRLAGAKMPGDSLRWTTSVSSMSSQPTHFHPGVTRTAEARGTTAETIFPSHREAIDPEGVFERKIVESFKHYLASSENY